MVAARLGCIVEPARGDKPDRTLILFNSCAFNFGYFSIAFFEIYRIGRYSCNLSSLWLATALLLFSAEGILALVIELSNRSTFKAPG